MAKLHRTPVHARMLRAVWEGHISWVPTPGRLRFTYAESGHPVDVEDSTALWELMGARLIYVTGSAARSTAEGARRLSEWEQVSS